MKNKINFKINIFPKDEKPSGHYWWLSNSRQFFASIYFVNNRIHYFCCHPTSMPMSDWHADLLGDITFTDFSSIEYLNDLLLEKLNFHLKGEKK